MCFIKATYTKTVLCFFIIKIIIIRTEENLCPKVLNCTCLDGTDKISVNCRGIHKINLLSSIFRDIDFQPISYMKVSECSVSSLPEDIFKYSSIDELDLKCPFKRLADKSLSTINSLIRLKVSQSKLKQIPQAIRKLKVLRFLQIVCGHLTRIDDELQNLIHLNSLNLANNKIETISKDAFSRNLELRTIDLKRNRIKEIAPKTFQPCRNLEKINVAYNKLQTFEGITIGESLLVSDKFKIII